jgi:putative SOS response-associated peptidase YedK
MCGRFAQTGKAKRKALTLAEEMQRQIQYDAAVRADTYNLAPSTLARVLRSTPGGVKDDGIMRVV